MEFFVKKNKNEKQRVTIDIPQNTVNSAVLTEFIKISKKTSINGFRKGKIPIEILKKKYGNQIYYDVFNQLMQKFFYKFLDEKKIKIIGSPKYHIHKNNNEKKSFKYSVLYELYPKIKIHNLELITVKKIYVHVTNKDIENNINYYRTGLHQWKISQKPSKMYDRITIDYEAYQGNKKLEKYSRKNINFVLFKNTLLPELNHKLLNHYINDIVFFKIKFNKFYPETYMQNKIIFLKIKIKKIETKEIIEETDNHKKEKYQIKKLNCKEIQDLACKLNKKINSFNEEYLHKNIIEEIANINSICIPKVLLEEKIRILYDYNKKQYDQKKEHFLEKKYHANIELKARKKVYMQLIKKQVVIDKKISIDSNKIKLFIKNISLHYENPLEIIKLYNKNKNFQYIIHNMALEKEIMDILSNSVNIIKENWTFEKFINCYENFQEELTI